MEEGQDAKTPLPCVAYRMQQLAPEASELQRYGADRGAISADFASSKAIGLLAATAARGGQKKSPRTAAGAAKSEAKV